jgi:hypothetical protein
MKLRTVLRELGCTDSVEGPGVDFDADVVVFPLDAPGASPSLLDIPELVTLRVDGVPLPREGIAGVTLVAMGRTLPDGMERPCARVVTFATESTPEELASAFRALPELHVYLDLQQKRLFKAFQTSYDIQRFADRAHEILGNPLLVVNSDRRLLASSGDFPEGRADVRTEIEQGYLFEEVDAELEAAGILDDVRHAGHAIISENERFGQRWVTSIISHHHMEMGRLDLLEQDHVIRDCDLELVDFAGSLAGIIIERLGLAGKRAGSGSSVLDDILGNALFNEKTMRAQLVLSAMPLDDTYVIATLAGERDIPRAHLQRIASRIDDAFRYALWTARDGRLVVMVAIGARATAGWDAYERTERMLGQRKAFVSTLQHNGLRAFVSEPFEQLSLAQARYQQTIDLASSELVGSEPITYFWRHRFEVVASLAQTFGQVDMLLDKRVVAMSLYDRDHGTAYFDTACRTVEFPGSPAEAARALNVHRNTYFYRVNKIEELFFIDLRRGEDRLAVAFSTKILAVLGERLLFDVGDETWARLRERS